MKFAPIFQDHAVLQRDLSLPVWGETGSREAVTVTLAGLTAHTTSDPYGRWLVRFPAMHAGGPYELVAESSSGRAALQDILIGEVWVCSGQSNMEWKLNQSLPLDEEATAAMPQVRVLTVGNPAHLGRQEYISGKWSVGTSDALNLFSAVGCWFGRKLHAELGVPIGLIGNAWGGTRIQAWISREALIQDPVIGDQVREYENFVFAPNRIPKDQFVSFQDWERRGAPQDQGNRGLEEGWANLQFDDSAWKTMPVPSRWQDYDVAENGVLWFRQTVTVPAEWIGKKLELNLGAVDKHDDTYVNGERVGGLSWEAGPNAWAEARVYEVPAHLVGPDGRVCIAVRARSHVYHGGLIGNAAGMRLAPLGAPSAQPIPLAGDWRYAIEQNWGLVTIPTMLSIGGRDNPNSLSILFDSRITPLLPYGIRGVIWYQGESNASEAELYRRLMVTMIRDWRRAWGQGDFPFLQVQLANYQAPQKEPCSSQWAELRDAQFAALSEPNTGMAVAIDVGEAGDIHPRDKRSVGLRLAQWALAENYGRGGLASGPLYAGKTDMANGRIRIHFRNATGLRTREGGAPQHVAIAGLDKKFVWAQSIIEGESLIVWHPEIAQPLSVRYAWAENPDTCNLVNAVDLPASPFRTDSW
jgi:sialate O-acetylesterase